jgi:predicted amidohydrolase YtcJ
MLYADSIFLNGNLITLESALPRAQALATRDGKIVAVGSDDDLRDLIGTHTRVHNLDGRTVVPGFHDAHCHILELGFNLSEADTRAATSISEVARIISEFAQRAKSDDWIRGFGYNQNKLAARRHPTRYDLDAASPVHPVFLSHVSGHMAVVNSRALALAHISRDMPDPEGGVIERDAEGEPTGLLKETAQELVRQVMPPYSFDAAKRALAAAGRYMAAMGITSAQDAWSGWIVPEEFRAYQEVVGANHPARSRSEAKMQSKNSPSLPQRVRLMPDVESLSVRGERFAFGFGLRTGFGTERLKLGAIKIFLDGSLIGRTAALNEPYANDPTTRGFLVKREEKIREQVRRAHQGGWQVAMHAIGDYAIQVALDTIETVMGRGAARFRPRIEHCGILRRDLIERIRQMGVVVVTQPQFIAELGDGFREAIGEARLQLAYPFASLHGLHVAFSSDQPVVNGAPLLGIQAAVTERTDSGAAYVPAEAITVEEALRNYTLGAAYSAFEESENGSLAPGKWADFVVLSQDLLKTPPEELSKVDVLQTIIGGEIVYEK